MKFIRNITLSGVLFITVALILGACSGADNRKPNNSQGQKTQNTQQASKKADAGSKGTTYKQAPEFTLESMDGDSLSLSDYSGKIVVLNIWATWCPPCREEIPDFIDLQNKYKDSGVQFIGVSVDKKGWEVIRPFAEKYQINYPIVLDNGSVARKYGPLRGIPTTFFINREGGVEFVAPGKLSKQRTESILQKLM